MHRSACALAAAAWITACSPREPGPHPEEHGHVFYWRAVSSQATFAQCTDAHGWQSSIAAPELKENSYLVYELSEDGALAVAQECTTTDASTCVKSSLDIAFGVSGHSLIYDPPPATTDIAGSACDLEGDELWRIEDEGEAGTLGVSTAFNLVGPTTDCTALEAQVKSESSNGFGVDGCTVTLEVQLEFAKAEGK